MYQHIGKRKNIPAFIFKDAIAHATLLILHRIMHTRVSDQRIFIDEILVADLTAEFQNTMISFLMSLYVGRVNTHKTAFGTWYDFQHV